MVAVAEIMNAEKWAEGLTWEQYSASIQANKEGFMNVYDTFSVAPEEATFFKAYNARKGGNVKMAIIGEDWCPDVVRGLPVAVRVAEAGGMECKIFPRDSHPDLREAFLWRHEFQSIPVVVFYTGDFKELGHWIERPAIAYKQMAELNDTLKDLSQEERRAESGKRRATFQDEWKRETVAELRQLLYRVM